MGHMLCWAWNKKNVAIWILHVHYSQDYPIYLVSVHNYVCVECMHVKECVNTTCLPSILRLVWYQAWARHLFIIRWLGEWLWGNPSINMVMAQWYFTDLPTLVSLPFSIVVRLDWITITRLGKNLVSPTFPPILLWMLVYRLFESSEEKVKYRPTLPSRFSLENIRNQIK